MSKKFDSYHNFFSVIKSHIKFIIINVFTQVINFIIWIKKLIYNNQGTHLIKADLMPVIRKRFYPSLRVNVVADDERAINVEKYTFYGHNVWSMNTAI